MNKYHLGCFTLSGLIFAVLSIVILVALMGFQGNVLFSPGSLNAKSGAPLKGVSSHAELGSKCSACHAPFWQGAGMANLCLDCHNEIVAQQKNPQSLHGALFQGGISGSCWICHPDHHGTTTAVTVVNTAHFPHDKLGYPVPFPLTGAHRVVPCDRCHPNNAYKGAPTDCVSCHPEPSSHVGLFGSTCGQCHTTANWKATFDHPDSCGRVNCLHHDHATCADCHPDNYTTGTCTKCHRDNNPGGGDFRGG